MRKCYIKDIATEKFKKYCWFNWYLYFFLLALQVLEKTMQKVVIFSQDWVAIYLYLLACGIAIARLISMKFGRN